MKCTLEIYGETHESTEFTERQVSLFLAASAGSTGINIRDLFEELMGAQQLPVKGLREYSSLESAENDLTFVLKQVFPTLQRAIGTIDTTDLVTIVRPMLFALAGVEAPIEPVMTTPEPKTIVLAPPLMGDLHDWEYPPSASEAQSPEEETAIRYAARTLNVDDWQKVDCWYQWWKAVTDGEDVVDTATTIDVILQLTDQFTALECSQYSSAVLARLETLQQQPIAA